MLSNAAPFAGLRPYSIFCLTVPLIRELSGLIEILRLDAFDDQGGEIVCLRHRTGKCDDCGI